MSEKNDRIKHEKATAKFFKVKSSEIPKPFNREKFSKTGLFHIDQLSEESIQSALDVGCGPGGVLLGIGESTKEKLIGIDLSPTAIEHAIKRFEKVEYQGDTEFIAGSFLDIESQKVDGLSLHRVLCCHPDIEGMMNTAVSWQVKKFVITIPRYRFFNRFLFGIFSLFKRFTGGFRPYLHHPELLQEQLEKNGYQLTELKKWFVWESHVYELQ